MIYLIAINIITLLTFIADKARAGRHAWRIPEATLLGLAVMGGTIGALIGIFVVRHKSRHLKFKYGVPVILLIQTILLVYIVSTMPIS